MKANNKIIKFLIAASMILIPSMVMASSAKIGSVREGLSKQELKLLHHEEKNYLRNGIKPEHSHVNARIGSVRDSLSESEARSLYLEENKGHRINSAITRKRVSNVKIGSVRANLSPEDLARLHNEEVKGR